MKSYSKYCIITYLLLVTSVSFGQTSLDTFLADFDYESRKTMKRSSEQLVTLLQENKAVLVDIRFEEEQAAWQMDYAIKMPLPNLPTEYSELPKDKLIVTACPHKDRAIIAMVYLKTKGYNVAYLKDGLLGLAEHLRGDNANNFIKKYKK
ncbi:MAG: rhodanese-like domain-containing protein [Flavobacteriales bacterium]|nr:rhodanese-like domain-containing protein [Flavobacteriales bacterium]